MDKTGITDILSNIVNNYKKIDIKELPTQGYFYPKDFTVSVKKASFEDTLEYNFNYVKDKNGVPNLGVILFEVYKIIKRNADFGRYTFEDLKCNDVLYIFFEIVKYTMNKEIMIPYSDFFGLEAYIKFNSKNFNYFDFDSLGYKYNEDTREFIYEDYRASIPSIGVQNCLVDYVYQKEVNGENTQLNYDFLFFLGNRNFLSEDEMDNLIIIFNEDMEQKELDVTRDIVSKMAMAIPNTLKVGNILVNVDLKVDFENLFM
jgi:hypothetical protein